MWPLNFFVCFAIEWSEGLAAQSCPTLCNFMDCSPPGSPVHGILQARILEWVAIPFSRGSSRPRGWTQAFCIVGCFFTVWVTRETPFAIGTCSISMSSWGGLGSWRSVCMSYFGLFLPLALPHYLWITPLGNSGGLQWKEAVLEASIWICGEDNPVGGAGGVLSSAVGPWLQQLKQVQASTPME